MATQGYNYGQSAGVNAQVFANDIPWSLLAACNADDGGYTYVYHDIAVAQYVGGVYMHKDTATLGCSNFQFSIPTNAVVTKIECEVQALVSQNFTSPMMTVVPVYGGTSYGFTGGTTTTLSGSETTKLFTWNLSGSTGFASPATVNSSSFGIWLRIEGQDSSSMLSSYYSYVDFVRVRLTYQCASIGTIANSSLADGALSSYYSAQFSMTASYPVTWSRSAGTLPTGLTLNSTTGLLYGTPTAAGSFSFTIRATSVCDTGVTASKSFTMNITCSTAYRVTTTSINEFISGEVFAQTLASTLPVALKASNPWTLTTGTLPTGISFNQDTGEITGTPTAINSTSLTFSVEWVNGCIATKTFAVTFSLGKSASDLITNGVDNADSGGIVKQTVPYEESDNDKAWVMNINTGSWTEIDFLPVNAALFKSDRSLLYGTRRDKGNISKINLGDNIDGSVDINSTIQTGFMDFGDQDELREMEPKFSEALKRMRALFTQIRGEGNLILTAYTEENSTGVAFTITPDDTDNVIYNRVRTTLSRDVRGQFVSFKIQNENGENFWIGEMALKANARGLR